jgi:hypothetical protein
VQHTQKTVIKPLERENSYFAATKHKTNVLLTWRDSKSWNQNSTLMCVGCLAKCLKLTKQYIYVRIKYKKSLCLKMQLQGKNWNNKGWPEGCQRENVCRGPERGVRARAHDSKQRILEKEKCQFNFNNEVDENTLIWNSWNMNEINWRNQNHDEIGSWWNTYIHNIDNNLERTMKIN